MSSFSTLGIRDKISWILGTTPPTGTTSIGHADMWVQDSFICVRYNDGTIDYYSPDSSSSLYFSVINNTGAPLSKGDVVTPDETTVIALADCKVKNKSRIIAVLSQDLADGESGLATKLGQVSELDTSAFSEGQIVYLGYGANAGKFVADKPDDGGYIVIVGVVDVVDATNGIITVDTRSSDLTVEVTDTNGFPTDQRTGTTISFVDGTRTFTIAPTGSEFHFYELGDKYEKTGAESVVITNVTGGHIIYYDSGVLKSIANPTNSQVEDIILNRAIVSYIYWNAVTASHVLLWDERHGISMGPFTHLYLHETRGSQYVYGLALDGIVIGNGSLNSHAQFGNLLGKTLDEDLPFNIQTIASTVGYDYLYRSGSTGIWTKGSNPGYAFPVGSTPLPQYNEFTGSTYQLTEVTSGNYMLVHMFASNNNDLKLFPIIGDSEYGTVSAATAGANDEISRILGNLPLPEFVPVGTVIIEGKTSFTNSVNARVVQTTDSENYKDWRTTELATGAAPTNHNNLAGLLLANTGVDWGHIDDQPQTIYGKKTLNESPIITGLTPGRVMYVDTDGSLKDAEGLVWDQTNRTINIAPSAVGKGVYFDLSALSSTNKIAGISFDDDGAARLIGANGSVYSTQMLVVGDSFSLLPGRVTFRYSGYTSFEVTNKVNLNTEVVRFDASGRVGIKTIAPTKALHVAGDAGYTSTALEGTTDEDFASHKFVNDQIAAGVSTQTITSNATVTPTGEAREDEIYITAQAEALTIANPSGTPVNGNTLVIRIKDNGTARAITWGANYYAFAVLLPTTTIVSKTAYYNFIYDSAASKWNLVSVTNEI